MYNVVFFSNNHDSSGVINKMSSISNSIIQLGFKSNIINIESISFFEDAVSLIKLSFKLKDVAYLRYNNSKNFIFFIALIILKIRGVKIILDIPTPIINFLKEISISKSTFFKKNVIILSTLILGPLPFIISNLNIHYAHENWYFRLFNKKNLLIGNGINSKYYIPSKIICKKIIKHKFLTIANLAPWHGIDRALLSLSKVNYDFEYNIIGSGQELNNLKNIVKDLDLGKKVFFRGFLKKKDYLKYLHSSTLGIGSLAWDRVGVKTSSTLKNREYISSGIPCVFSTYDPDISSSSFGFEILQDQSSIDYFFMNIKFFFKGMPEKPLFFDFAKKELDMKVKLKLILDNLN